MTECFIDINEAARILGLHINTIKKRVAEAKAGLLSFPFYQDKPGGKLTFLRAELVQWRRNRRIEREIQARKERARCLSASRT